MMMLMVVVTPKISLGLSRATQNGGCQSSPTAAWGLHRGEQGILFPPETRDEMKNSNFVSCEKEGKVCKTKGKKNGGWKQKAKKKMEAGKQCVCEREREREREREERDRETERQRQRHKDRGTGAKRAIFRKRSLQ